ncbi:hypothetical protein [Xenorhabdus sp. BG5]|uniref:hypothetical protein n=1 Tax=Xenorhabdus sp. BG5 TaxID=2782014 RepID=UPI00187EEDED|nr:hypothetical protein [Xenorhabdus sp. BG5]MBE8598087.1 hypothetical protein [Xenorhabdus sp. BG5]
MTPSISFTYVLKEERTFNGRIYYNYHDLGDMKFDIPFSEFAKRSDPDPSEIITHLVNNCDEVSLVEAIIKSGMGRKIAIELDRQLHREAA